MTGIDSETSQDIAEAISLKGGRYLEAQIQGSKNQAQDGTLVILVAGDRSLFDDCQSCFQVRGEGRRDVLCTAETMLTMEREEK